MSKKTKIAVDIGRTVTEFWKSEDGYSWYRIWSDGWIEQCGITRPVANLTNSGSIKNFLIPFSDLKYSLLATYRGESLTGSGTVFKQVMALNLQPLSESQFKCCSWSATGSEYIQWYACGY